MSRTINEIQQDYGRAAAELGDLHFKRSLSEEEVEKLNYQIQKRTAQMQSLANEAKRLAKELEAKKNEVALPVEEKKDESKNS